uniref:Uncharacterized protein n=1 Tax=Laticauda laticaudata TaxID=8630 RepID=A0A8C5RVG4_LATLA
MNPHTIISQPQMTVTQHQTCEWQTDLFDCFNDWGVCICGMCCPLCLGCQIASEMNECPLCGITMAFRTLYRTRYGIPVSRGSLQYFLLVFIWILKTTLTWLSTHKIFLWSFRPKARPF